MFFVGQNWWCLLFFRHANGVNQRIFKNPSLSLFLWQQRNGYDDCTAVYFWSRHAVSAADMMLQYTDNASNDFRRQWQFCRGLFFCQNYVKLSYLDNWVSYYVMMLTGMLLRCVRYVNNKSTGVRSLICSRHIALDKSSSIYRLKTATIVT